ncbi:DUF1761 domain-containing protein [Bacillus sp. NEB1478]|uniref:DUF1761 domain-containing protein n=1 Tax=Bacillus sp. NEB1478 TaxID=3073816 RepID=UPI002873435E|nr:DUF1761 domain-containing protein [Bacillus sp. NEB1478]WNB90844.1 DUF1761 domain-containing protein [Bacillus sp. NEB1478]
MDFTSMNIWAILLCVAANGILGALWYSPVLFANQWVAARGLKMEEINRNGMGSSYAFMMIGALISAISLSLILSSFENMTIGTGAFTGFLCGFGIASMRELAPTMFEDRSKKLFFISAGYHTVSLTLMGIIIAAFI